MINRPTINVQIITPKCPNCGRLMKPAKFIKINGRKYRGGLQNTYKCRCGQIKYQ